MKIFSLSLFLALLLLISFTSAVRVNLRQNWRDQYKKKAGEEVAKGVGIVGGAVAQGVPFA